MKTRFMKIVMIMFALIIAFSFAACEKSNDYQSLLDKITELEQKLDDKQTASDKALADIKKQLQDADSANLVLIQALQVKVTALEAANTQYKAQVEVLTADIQSLVKTHAADKAALEAAIKANSDAAVQLKADLDSLTASVANATKIERMVVKADGFKEYTHPIVRTVYVEQGSAPSTKGFLKVNCTLGHDNFSFNYQLITFKAIVTVNEQVKNFDISVTQAKSNDSRVDQTFQTDIVYSNSDTYSVTWFEIVLYRFI